MNVQNEYNSFLLEYLITQFNLKKFRNCWLISSSDAMTDHISLLNSTNKFIVNYLLNVNDISSHPDYKLIRFDHKNTIGDMEQIKQLIMFLNCTPIAAKCKVAVLYRIDCMNIYASNACLKTLEDIHQNCYIFLITQRLHNILYTLISRCALIKIKSHVTICNTNYTLILIRNLSYDIKIQLIDYILHNELLQDFILYALDLLSKIMKIKIKTNINLTSLEFKICQQLVPNSIFEIINKFKQIQYIAYNSTKYDIDKTMTIILIIHKFY